MLNELVTTKNKKNRTRVGRGPGSKGRQLEEATKDKSQDQVEVCQYFLKEDSLTLY